MKKVVLSSVVALSLFAVAAPVFAQGENAESSNQLIQKKYSSWRDSADEANTQVAAHEAEINAEKDAAVVAAKAALEQYGSGHEYGKYAEKVEEARTEARNTVRNKYVAQLQDKYTAAAKSQGNYYNETGVEANRTNEQRIADDKAAQGQAGQAGQNGQAGENGKASQNGQKPASSAEAAASEAKAGNGAKAGKDAKAGQKAAGKALPKTSAVK